MRSGSADRRRPGTMGIGVTALLAVLAVSVGSCNAGRASLAGAGRKLSRAEAEACVQGGGTVQRDGVLQYERCTKRFTDAGKECRDSSDCEGRCLAENPMVKSGAMATGSCEIDDSPFGCWAEIEGGVVVRSMCVD